MPVVRAPSAILVDLDTGRVLFAKDPTRRLPIASLTKIMTGLLVVQREHDLSATVVVSRRAARTAPTDIGLVPGERTTVRALLYGLLLWSGNDAAVALAEHVGGSVPRFLHLMNARAGKLGLADTHFASTNGLNDHGFSTAADLAALTRAALRNATFAKVVATARRSIAGPKVQAVHRLHNRNAMLTTYRGSIGVKTGYTSAAGDCVVEAARRDGRTLIAVVLGDPPATHWRDAYGDARRLLDYGFASNALPGMTDPPAASGRLADLALHQPDGGAGTLPGPLPDRDLVHAGQHQLDAPVPDAVQLGHRDVRPEHPVILDRDLHRVALGHPPDDHLARARVQDGVRARLGHRDQQVGEVR